MTLTTDHCTFRMVSDAGRGMAEGDDEAALVAFTRRILACPRIRDCPYGDYCTIFAASLLAERDKFAAADF